MNETSFPIAFEQSLDGLPGVDAGALLRALRTSPPVSIRYNKAKRALPAAAARVPWCNTGVYLPDRPVFTLDPLWHGGAYYVQEASSMAVAQLTGILSSLGERCRVLDLCAAPGGKSTLLASLLPADGLLVSNEVIRSRAAILLENLVKWGAPNVVVTTADPKQFAALPAFFDLLLVDAPCSGEGLFRKELEAVHEWSEANVQRCADRQRCIVADAWDTLRDGGIVVYSSCTFNRHENEETVQWIVRQLGAECLPLPLDPAWGIVESDSGYRFYPHRLQGEGFFISVLQKRSPHTPHPLKAIKTPRPATAALDVAQIGRWLHGAFVPMLKNRLIYALPQAQQSAIAQLLAHLPVLQAGVPAGERKGNDTTPTTALALSIACRREAFPCVTLSLPEAIRYLRRENIHFPDAPNGYLLVTYDNLPLGFAKKIGHRTNNLFPMQWRIRMDGV
ncbi:MAG: rRNA cytosine-C5-methyltransferase [Prevotellaceae bacterium]|nr:rRNA cytosine-C5-methyltransferase [Prevotellaceae bacterium]